MDRQSSDDIMRFLDGMASSDDVLFGFLDEGNHSPDEFSDSGNLNGGEDEDHEEEGNSNSNSEENRAFWQEQEQLLQGTLYRTSSIEAKVRQATKEALKQVKSEGLHCTCRRPEAGGCPSCLRGEISRHLRDVGGYHCFVSKSKWRSTQDIPSGEHEYIEVVERSMKGEMRVVIELSFRAEFEIAKGGEEYKRLVARLPEVYVGKTERLRALIKILCIAGKRCLRDKKMHMGPWRKHKYMQAKWLGTCDRSTSVEAVRVVVSEPTENRGPRVSMLNHDGLFDRLSAGPAAVSVVCN